LRIAMRKSICVRHLQPAAPGAPPRRIASHRLKVAHFSDRGRLFQADRGRRFSAIVDAQGMRASEGLNVSQAPGLSQDGDREASGLSSLVQTYPRRRVALATYRPTRWVSRLWCGDGCAHWSLPVSRSVAPLSAMR